MNYTKLWAKTTLNKMLAGEALKRYGNKIKWKDNNAYVLEVGCGDGSLTNTVFYPYVKDRIEKIVAVDKFKRMIDYAQQNNDIRNIDFRVMDVTNKEEVEKLEAQFDNIFSFHVAHWIPDHRTFISALHKMLKRDGQIFVTLATASPLHDAYHKHFIEGTWSKYVPQERVFGYYTDKPVEYVQKTVGEVGFNVEVCEKEKKRNSIINYPDYMRALISLHPHLHRIPPEQQANFIDYHLQVCIENATYLSEPDVYEIKYEVLTCIASKQK